jgi:hypothetical protein
LLVEEKASLPEISCPIFLSICSLSFPGSDR